jgi:hypothetical protein
MNPARHIHLLILSNSFHRINKRKINMYGGGFFFGAIREIKIYNKTVLTDSRDRMRFYHG